jgi:hypothetical protein
MGRTGRHRVETKLNWGASAEILLEAYGQLFGRPSAQTVEARNTYSA